MLRCFDVGRTRRGCGVDFTGANATNERWSLCGIACSTNYEGGGATIHVVEQFVDVVMPQIKEDIVEMVQANPQECISERIVEQIVYVSVLEILEKSVKVESVSPQRRKINAQVMEFVGGRERSLTAAGAAARREQIVAAPVPHIVKELLEVNEDVPQRIAEQIVEEWVGLVQTIIQERVSERVT